MSMLEIINLRLFFLKFLMFMNLIPAYLDFNALLRVVDRVLVTFEDQGEMLFSAFLKLSHKRLHTSQKLI